MLSSSAYRHMLVRKWREVVRQEVRAATARAKQLETRAWLEKGVVVQVQACQLAPAVPAFVLPCQQAVSLRALDCVYTIDL